MEQLKQRRVLFALAAILALASALALSACGGSDDGTTSSSPETAAETASEEVTCEEVEAPAPKNVSFKAPKQVIEPDVMSTATVKTNCGTFEIELDTKRAPKTGNSFAFLAEEGFYDDVTFHRVVPGFVIQGGDPEGTGIGGPGYVVDEKPPANLSYTKGVVAMAKSETDPPGRSGSQFYIVTAPDAGLPPEYALVGKVTSGYEVVEAIEKLGGSDEKPTQTVLIEEMTIQES
ncbi:MAG TPA: peptidylprolyl isomerase [Solirubrobacterales bacterium]|nr:peptidylprolyl isomerase [Solirubrobacterales bacterium]